MLEQKRRRQAKERIIEEASWVFAEKGFRDATHAEICRRANTNIASINYYFESKEALYRKVIGHLVRLADATYPLNGNLPPTAQNEERLWAFIHNFVRRALDPSDVGNLHRILTAERFAPTGLLDDLLACWFESNRSQLLPILQEFLGPGASERVVAWTEMCTVGQMIGLHDSGDAAPRHLFGIDQNDARQLTDHIYNYTLGGIETVRNRLGKTHEQSRTEN
jgi:AcrR family transcriptional regulator